MCKYIRVAIKTDYLYYDIKLNYPIRYAYTNYIYIYIYIYRLLSVFLTHQLDRAEAFKLLLHNYKTMCEAGWDVHIILLISARQDQMYDYESDEILQFIKGLTYCTRIDASLYIQYIRMLHGNTIYAPEQSRILFKEYLERYDVFIYQEGDMVLDLSHVEGYVRESQILQDTLIAYNTQYNSQHTTNTNNNTNNNTNSNTNLYHYNESHGSEYMIGFRRYINLPEAHNHTNTHSTHKAHKAPAPYLKLTEGYVYQEASKTSAVCISDKPYIRTQDNLNQGFHILTRMQIKQLDNRCQFLSHAFFHGKWECGACGGSAVCVLLLLLVYLVCY